MRTSRFIFEGFEVKKFLRKNSWICEEPLMEEKKHFETGFTALIFLLVPAASFPCIQRALLVLWCLCWNRLKGRSSVYWIPMSCQVTKFLLHAKELFFRYLRLLKNLKIPTVWILPYKSSMRSKPSNDKFSILIKTPGELSMSSYKVISYKSSWRLKFRGFRSQLTRFRWK